MARKAGSSMKEVYWTIGQYDIVAIVEAPDDASLTALMLTVGSLGNVRTQSLRAFTAGEMTDILGRVGT